MMKSKITFLTVLLSAMLVCNVTIYAHPGNDRPSPCDLKTDMRKLWEDHITWTRNVIFNFIDSLPGTTEAVNRLLQNQVDIGDAIKPYYGVAAGNQLTALLTTHITEAATILTDLVTGSANLNADIAAWYQNADSIAMFLAGANPYLPLADMTQMMHDHLDLTTQEALARFNHDYVADVAAYDAVHNEILSMSDMISEAIVRQFRNMFSGPAARPEQNVTLNNNVIALFQNFPNPFDESTVIYYTLNESVNEAQIVFTDVRGSVIKTVQLENRGEASLKVFAPDLRKGIYTYSIVADGKVVDSKQMIH
jgi:hypothetical protein